MKTRKSLLDRRELALSKYFQSVYHKLQMKEDYSHRKKTVEGLPSVVKVYSIAER